MVVAPQTPHAELERNERRGRRAAVARRRTSTAFDSSRSPLTASAASLSCASAEMRSDATSSIDVIMCGSFTDHAPSIARWDNVLMPRAKLLRHQ